MITALLSTEQDINVFGDDKEARITWWVMLSNRTKKHTEGECPHCFILENERKAMELIQNSCLCLDDVVDLILCSQPNIGELPFQNIKERIGLYNSRNSLKIKELRKELLKFTQTVMKDDPEILERWWVVESKLLSFERGK